MSNAVNSGAGTGTRTAGRTTMQKAAMAVGIVFLAFGVLGFIPGITTRFDTMSFGHGSQALLLGLFQVSILHNLVHLLFGVAGVVLAKTYSGARKYLLFGGIIYLVLFLYGLIIDQDTAANFIPINTADDYLHLVLGIGMIGLAVALARKVTHRSNERV